MSSSAGNQCCQMSLQNLETYEAALTGVLAGILSPVVPTLSAAFRAGSSSAALSGMFHFAHAWCCLSDNLQGAH